MKDKVLSLLSLAKKAGRIGSGETAVLDAIRGGDACLVLIASDASEGTAKKFRDKTGYYEVPCMTYGTKESLGRAIGTDIRSVVAVKDRGLADSIISRLEEADINGKKEDQ